MKKAFSILLALVLVIGMLVMGCPTNGNGVEPTTVDIASIPGVTPPATGGTPVTSVSTAQYTGTVAWDPAHTTIRPGVKYKATITLLANTGFTFAGVSANFFSVAGATCSNAAGSGVVTAHFPGTEPVSLQTVTFTQLRWMADPEEFVHEFSNVGVVTFNFSAGAGLWLLAEHDGGWINVVADTSDYDGGREQWAVQNLYLNYPDVSFLAGSSPSVMFSLRPGSGDDEVEEVEVDRLKAAVFLTSEPLETQPQASQFNDYTVALERYLAGGLGELEQFEGGSAHWDIPRRLIVWELRVPWVDILRDLVLRFPRVASVRIPVAEISAINEGHSGCAPGSVARSISYLGRVHGLSVDAPQTIYNDLVTDMNTQISVGTYVSDMLNGKNAYVAREGLPIDTRQVSTGPDTWAADITDVQNRLDEGCDVEILIAWSGEGGHAAMVTSVSRWANGSAVIHYVDDPAQGNNRAENREWVISTDEKGDFGDGVVFGFIIQCPTPTSD